MITFPFFCPVCLRDADAEADPTDIVFGGTSMGISCTFCGTTFRAEVERGSLVPKEQIGGSEDDAGQ